MGVLGFRVMHSFKSYVQAMAECKIKNSLSLKCVLDTEGPEGGKMGLGLA